MTKYEIKHEWVKELGLKKGMAEMADSATDHIGAILDKSDVKDIAFLSSWMTLGIIMYKSGATRKLVDAIGAADWLTKFNLNPFTIEFYTGIYKQVQEFVFGVFMEKPQTQEDYERILTEIGLSMVFSYFILTQGGTVVSAFSAIGGLLK